MVPSLPLLPCESSVSVKENPDRKKYIYLIQISVFHDKKARNAFVRNGTIFPTLLQWISYIKIHKNTCNGKRNGLSVFTKYVNK